VFEVILLKTNPRATAATMFCVGGYMQGISVRHRPEFARRPPRIEGAPASEVSNQVGKVAGDDENKQEKLAKMKMLPMMIAL
jgi:hypothetical protein